MFTVQCDHGHASVTVQCSPRRSTKWYFCAFILPTRPANTYNTPALLTPFPWKITCPQAPTSSLRVPGDSAPAFPVPGSLPFPPLPPPFQAARRFQDTSCSHHSWASPPKRGEINQTKQEDFKSLSVESGSLFPARLGLFITQKQTLCFSSFLHCGTYLCSRIQALAKWTLLVLLAEFCYKFLFSGALSYQKRSLCFSINALYPSLFPFLQPELGKPMRNCYSLPGFDFTYGMYMHKRDGGVPEGRTLLLKHRPATKS